MTRTDDEIEADVKLYDDDEFYRSSAAARLAADVPDLLGRVAALTEELANADAMEAESLAQARGAKAERDDAELRVARAETALVVERARREAAKAEHRRLAILLADEDYATHDDLTAVLGEALGLTGIDDVDWRNALSDAATATIKYFREVQVSEGSRCCWCTDNRGDAMTYSAALAAQIPAPTTEDGG